MWWCIFCTEMGRKFHDVGITDRNVNIIYDEHSHQKTNRKKKNHYLRSYVIRRAAKCLGDGIATDLFFTHAKIRNFDVPILIQQDVVQFEVPIDNSMSVEEEETNRNFCCVKPVRKCNSYDEFQVNLDQK